MERPVPEAVPAGEAPVETGRAVKGDITFETKVSEQDYRQILTRHPSKRERWHLESWWGLYGQLGWTRRLWLALGVSSAVTFVTEALRDMLGRTTSPREDWRHRLA